MAKATPENGEKTTIGLISKKATLHVQHPFFVHFFAVGLHDHNINFQKLFYGGNVVRVLVHFFFTATHFLLALAATSISLFVTATTKFSWCSS